MKELNYGIREKTEYSQMQYAAIDNAKLIFSILVVALHCGPLSVINSEISYYFTQCVTRIAVPFFFICNGFFAFSYPPTKNGTAILRQCVKLIRMYVIWTIIYIPGFISTYSECDHPIKAAIVGFVTGKSYSHLWYLAAAAVALLLTSVAYRTFKSWKKVLMLAGVLYIIGLSYDSYYGMFRALAIWNVTAIHTVAKGALSVIQTTRDGVFFGFFFVAAGAVVAKSHEEIQKALCKKGAILSFTFGIVEVVIVRLAGWQRRQDAVDMYLFLVPTSVFLFCWLLKSDNAKPISHSNIRKESTLIYLIHIWVRTIWLRLCIPVLSKFPVDNIHLICENAMVVFIVDVVASFLLAKLYVQVSLTKRGKWLRKWIA